MSQTEKTIRQRMPRGYTAILINRTGRTQGYITNVVNKEKRESPIWPDILLLAEEWTKTQNELVRREKKVKAKAVAL